jgi:hypothetical protein
MTDNDRLRKLLEPEAPRLSGAAASRLETRVEAALAGPAARRPPRWAFVAAPALLTLLALAWLRPWQAEAPAPEASGYFVMSEEDYLRALADYQASGSSLDSVLTSEDGDDADVVEFDHSNWSDEDWTLFQSELENFQLTDNGGR